MWWLFVTAFGVGNILLHEQANDLARQLVRAMGLSLFLWSTRLLALAGAITILFFLRRGFLSNPDRLKKLLIFIPFALTLDLSLIVYPSERIHYLQYGLLTLIAYKAIGKALPAALTAFVFGYLDEAHQYWFIYAHDPTVYFDWNDIVLNLLAAIIALVFLLPEAEPVRKIPKRNVFAALVVWILADSLLVFLLNPDQYLLGNESRNSFWITSGINTHYHVLNAWEGTIILGIILIITLRYYWPDQLHKSLVDSYGEAASPVGAAALRDSVD